MVQPSLEWSIFKWPNNRHSNGHVQEPDYKDGHPTREKDTVAEETSKSPEEGQFPIYEPELVVGSGQKIPTFQFLALESLSDLVLNDARHSCLDVIKDIT